MYTLDDARQCEQAGEFLKAADIYRELGEFSKAKALYLALQRQHPFHKQIRFKLGQVLVHLHEWDNAIMTLQTAQQEGMFQEEILYLLAECFKQKGLIYAAREAYSQLLERNEHYKDARQQLRALESPGLSQLTTVHPASALSAARKNAEGVHDDTHLDLPVEDRYVLIEELGRGGMGVVYKARATASNRLVAIKVLPTYLAEDEMTRIRFFREAGLVARLHHRHIVEIIETNLKENFIVMEYIPGGTLFEWKQSHPSDDLTLFMFLAQILDALHVVHEQGIIHRDLKPDNILIADPTTAKLTDFGIAHICGATITHTGTHPGTLPYMSPEQVLGDEIDRRADIYSIGAMLYELLTGDVPFTGADTSYHHIHTPPRPPRDLVPTIAPQLDAMILKCLAKRPDDRYQDGQALRAEMLTLLSAMCKRT